VTTGLENQNSGEFTSRDISEEKVVELTKRRSSLRQHVCPLQFIVLWCLFLLGTKVCRYNWHSAGFLGWPFSMLKYQYIFQIKYTEAILSNSTRKALWFEIIKMLIEKILLRHLLYFSAHFRSIHFIRCDMVIMLAFPLVVTNDWIHNEVVFIQFCHFSHTFLQNITGKV